MLEELTNDIHQSPNKQKVLMELANCIASGEQTYQRGCLPSDCGIISNGSDLFAPAWRHLVSISFVSFLGVTKVMGDIARRLLMNR